MKKIDKRIKRKIRESNPRVGRDNKKKEDDKMKKEGRYKLIVSMFVIVGMIFAGALPLAVSGGQEYPEYDIEQDSNGNYHKAFTSLDPLPPGNLELYYTNDIGGQYPMDWNPPTKITNTTTASMLLDLGIYLPTDKMFIIWHEVWENGSAPAQTYYTLSGDYGANWREPERSYETITLKYAEFDPLIEEPDLPAIPPNYYYYIVQMKTPMIEDWRNGIENAGGIFCGAIHHNAYHLWMSDTVKAQVEQLPYIRWIGYYHPAYKIESGLLEKSGILELNVEVIEETGGQVNLNKVITEIEALGGLIIYDGSGSYIVKTQIDAGRINNIAFIPEVEWIDKISRWESGMNVVRSYTGAKTVHEGLEGFDGDGIIGSIIDDGIDQTHPDFDGQIEDTEPNEVPDGEHGTCCFGILFSKNQADAKGMLPSGSGVFYDEAIYKTQQYNSLQDLKNNKNGVFQSVSAGHGSTKDYTDNSNEIDRAVFDFDITRVTSMANYGDDGMSEEAIAKNTISVGAVNHKNTLTLDDDEHRPTSSTGPTSDGRFKPDLVGPGDQIYTTDSVDGDREDGYAVGNYFDNFGDTSGATSVVAGAAGLVYQMYRENHFGNNPTGTIVSSASTVKALLIANAYQYDFTKADRNEQGWGSVDIGKVYEIGDKHFIINEDYAVRGPDAPPIQNWVQYDIFVQNNQPLKISLVWTDPPGKTSDSKHLKNDLNLRVIDPNGIEYWGNNGLDTSKWSSSGVSFDSINNVENVFIETPEEGKWQIYVIGQDITEDAYDATTWNDQAFALVVSYNPAKAIRLYQGWNLISLPLIQPDTSTDVVLRSIDGYYDHWCIYNGQTKRWEHHPSDINHYMGIDLHVINCQEIDLIVYGDHILVDQEIELYNQPSNGWNLVGYPSQFPNERDAALDPLAVGDEIDIVQWYDTQTDTYHDLQAGQDFELGRGYWFHVNAKVAPSVTWIVPHDQII